MSLRKVYLATFNSCIYESANETLSAHQTREGAEQAITNHKKKHAKDNKRQPQTWEAWGVVEMEVKP